jgi:DNA-binding HxlR family transcriptional regulator
MRHTYRDVEHCGVKMALKLISGKWTPIIYYHLMAGPLRFTELWREIPRVSKKVLLTQVRQLEAAGLLMRTVQNNFPPEVTYQLTPKGAALAPILQSLDQWAMSNVADAVHLPQELPVVAQ